MQQEDPTMALRQLDDEHRSKAAEILDNPEMYPAVKQEALKNLASDYKDKWLLEHENVIRKMDEKAAKLRRIAEPPDTPPEGERGILEELVRDRTRRRIERLYGEGGPGAEQRLVIEYKKAVEQGDTKAQKEYEAALPDLLSHSKASGDFHETMKAAKWARMSERQRQAHKDLEELERANGATRQGLAMQASSRRRGYRPVDPALYKLTTHYAPGQKPRVDQEINQKVAFEREFGGS